MARCGREGKSESCDDDGTEFIPYAGDGFAILIPGYFNPSKEQDFPGTVLR